MDMTPTVVICQRHDVVLYSQLAYGMDFCLAWLDWPCYMRCCGGWCMVASRRISTLLRCKTM